jgi:hypothetical protein
MTKSTLHSVANHGITDRLADHEADLENPFVRLHQVDDERPGPCPTSGANRLTEALARGQAVFASQHALSRAAV